MMICTADLHIHTALSPCGADEMTPPRIVSAASKQALAMIAVCDHNSADNVWAVQQAAGDAISVLAGMEITTAEEVHVLGLFPDAQAAVAASGEVAATLPDATESDYRRFGEQRLMDAAGATLGRERKLLASASGLGLEDTVKLIHRHGGLAIAAHVNRPSFSVMSQLGFIPTDVGFDALEVFSRGRDSSELAGFESYGLPTLRSSDSHCLTDIGSVRTELTLAAPTFAELASALQGREGRGVRYA